MTEQTVEIRPLQLLRADPHEWGPGAVHQFDLIANQTLCGKTRANCPGKRFTGPFIEITCKACLRSIDAKARAAQRREEWAAEQAERERQREANRRAWREAYDRYLWTPTWRRKRSLVLSRAGGRCEGCGDRPATQVHHLRYPENCFPGDADWVAHEKLFDLVAICDRCHEDVHWRSP